MPTEYGNLFEYFKVHYKNSNKGIKGRGKARKVVGREARSKPVHAGGRQQACKIEPAVLQPSSQLSPVDARYDGLMSMSGSVPNPHCAGQMVYSHGPAPQMMMPNVLF